MRRSWLAASLAVAVSATVAANPSQAFDDAEFCVAARELVRSSAGDVGTWTDRYTRNDGVDIGCDLKTVHFKRYYKAPASALRDAQWKERQAEIWEGATCNRPMWRDAVGNGWVVSATVTTVTGERVWLACLPDGRGFFRAMP
jgi:hypothetical protein